MDISVVIPLLNEEESLPELADWIARVMREKAFTYEVVMVDDGSKDRSWQVIQSLMASDPSVKGIKFRRNYGKSAALQVGFDRAQGDVIITMDADLQDSPDEIPELFDMIKVHGFDMVSGWKKIRHDPISKTIPTKLFNFATRLMSGIKLHDFNCGLKAYRREAVKSVEIYGEMHRYIPVMIKWAGFTKIGEKVVEHRERKYGTTKFGLERFINGFLDLLSIFFITKFSRRPMHFFGSVGLLTFFCGFVIALYLTYEKLFLGQTNLPNRPLFYLGLLAMIIGSQLLLSGFLGELLARNANDKNRYQIEVMS
ncbi:MAG: glycosyltransferase family 2 protein [Patescibacteria group bacterium]